MEGDCKDTAGLSINEEGVDECVWGGWGMCLCL